MFLPVSTNLPWKPDQITIQGKDGYVVNRGQVDYIKDLIKALSSMYSEISNAHNVGSYRNNGTATVASGDTSVDVAHALNKTPGLKDIQITPINIPSNVVRWAVTAVDDTDFTITTSGDPGASGALFAWSVHILG